MDRLVKWVLRTVLGLAVMIAWWTIRGGDSNVQTADEIPASVWGGGGATMTIEVHTTCAAVMRVSFDSNQEDVESLATHEDIEAGTHTWTIDVPRDVGGYVELGGVEPHKGDTMSWRILLNEQVVDEQFDELEEELEDGYAFFIQSYFDDYATGQFATD